MHNFGRGMWRRVGDFQRIHQPVLDRAQVLQLRLDYYLKQQQINEQKFRHFQHNHQIQEQAEQPEQLEQPSNTLNETEITDKDSEFEIETETVVIANNQYEVVNDTLNNTEHVSNDKICIEPNHHNENEATAEMLFEKEVKTIKPKKGKRKNQK